MANTLDIKLVIKHLANGTLGENLCIICLLPLNESYENIFTEVCKENEAYCIAGVLDTIADIKFTDAENFNICIDCFKMASVAYKFYLLSKRSNEILNFYTDAILSNLDSIELLQDQISTNSLCLSLPYTLPETQPYDYDIQGIGLLDDSEAANKTVKSEPEIKPLRATVKQENPDSDDIVMVINDNGEPLFFNVSNNGCLTALDQKEVDKYKLNFPVPVSTVTETKKRKKRLPMSLKQCDRCPEKYRFVAKLKEHMKSQHDIELYICKVCKLITENELEYHKHLKTHSNLHQCALCNVVFKKRSTIIKHLEWHDKMQNISKTDGAHMCDVCGSIQENERSLQEHYDNTHLKKYTCFYCGRLYKGEASFERHIKKHEAYMQGQGENSSNMNIKVDDSKKDVKKKCECPICGRFFVDERSLMWHQRLHNDDKPFACDECGRRFVCAARRNQHARTAHAAPARACPLCAATFHMNSMVNTHIKKVHLAPHKRRNRARADKRPLHPPAPVPLPELAVDIQHRVLDLQAAERERPWEITVPIEEANMEDLV